MTTPSGLTPKTRRVLTYPESRKLDDFLRSFLATHDGTWIPTINIAEAATLKLGFLVVPSHVFRVAKETGQTLPSKRVITGGSYANPRVAREATDHVARRHLAHLYQVLGEPVPSDLTTYEPDAAQNRSTLNGSH